MTILKSYSMLFLITYFGLVGCSNDSTSSTNNSLNHTNDSTASAKLKSESLVGTWNFKTKLNIEKNNNGSTTYEYLSGTLIVNKNGNESLDCKLMVFDHKETPIYPSYNQDTSSAQESCIISENNNVVSIISKVDSSTGKNYEPDNFTLKLIENHQVMNGQLNSNFNVEATFVKLGAVGYFTMPMTLLPSQREKALASLEGFTIIADSVDGCVFGVGPITTNENSWRRVTTRRVCETNLGSDDIWMNDSIRDYDCATETESRLIKSTDYGKNNNIVFTTTLSEAPDKIGGGGYLTSKKTLKSSVEESLRKYTCTN